MVDVKYPRYLGKRNETINNSGTLLVPEGTIINWNVNIKEDSSSRVEKLSEYLAANGLKDGLIEAVKLTEANKSNIMPLYDYLKGKKSQELELIDHMTRYVKQRDLSYKQLESFTSALKWYEKAAVFNNYSPEKLAGLMLAIN